MSNKKKQLTTLSADDQDYDDYLKRLDKEAYHPSPIAKKPRLSSPSTERITVAPPAELAEPEPKSIDVFATNSSQEEEEYGTCPESFHEEEEQELTLSPAKKTLEKTPQKSSKNLEKTPQKSSKYHEKTPQKSSKYQEKTPQKSSKIHEKTPQKLAKNLEKTPQKSSKNLEKTPEKSSKIHEKTPKKYATTPRKLPNRQNPEESDSDREEDVGDSQNPSEDVEHESEDDGSEEIGEKFGDSTIFDEKEGVEKEKMNRTMGGIEEESSQNSMDSDENVMEEMEKERKEEEMEEKKEKNPSSRPASPILFDSQESDDKGPHYPDFVEKSLKNDEGVEKMEVDEVEDVEQEVDVKMEIIPKKEVEVDEKEAIEEYIKVEMPKKNDEKQQKPPQEDVKNIIKAQRVSLGTTPTKKEPKEEPTDSRRKSVKKETNADELAVDTRIIDEQCTTNLVFLKNQFRDKRLQFKPDFRHPDYKPMHDCRYCDIRGLPPRPEYTRKFDQINQNQWRPEDWVGMHNPRYAREKLTLVRYLRENRYAEEGSDGGYFMFTYVLQQLWRCPDFLELPGLNNYYIQMSRQRGHAYVSNQFANLIRVALTAERVLPSKLYLFHGDVKSATLSHEQCAALVARMFFNGRRYDAFNFRKILESATPLAVEKLKFLFAYFDRIVANCPQGTVSFRLVDFPQFGEAWQRRKDTVPGDVRIYSDMFIEETTLCSQVDFANKHLGGGVLGQGAVQEEIRFLMCPEMIVGMLFATDEMSDYQAISIVGAYVYSSYEEYGRKLRWKPLTARDARQNDAHLRDEYGRLRVETIAIDATKFEYSEKAIPIQLGMLTREIRKASVGFCAQGEGFDKIPIVTGFWGCGAFNGDKELKFLQQVVAAGIANRPLVFCTFGEEAMAQQCELMLARLRHERYTLSNINSMLRAAEKNMSERWTLFEYCMDYLNATDKFSES